MPAKLTNASWAPWAAAIAAPASPLDYNPPAMERFIRTMKPYIVDVKGVRPKFPARNRVRKISFDNEDQRKQYNLAWERYEREMILLKGGMKELGHFQQLVAMMKFSQAAELIRHEFFARELDRIIRDGKAAVLAVKFKETIAATVKLLVTKYGYSRDDISIIWGGMGGTFTADGKVKLREKRVPENIWAAFAPEDIEMLKTLNIRVIVTKAGDDKTVVKEIELSAELDERDKLTKAGLKSVGAKDLNELRLGNQNARNRQLEIDRFQTGKTKCVMFTFKAGGVGLSLHHHDNTCLPRESIIAPCYSAIEMVQGLGRAPRLTSLSETIQSMIFYKGTIEDHIADKVSEKLMCLREVVRQRESWEDVIVNAAEKDLKDFGDSDGDEITREVIDDGSANDEAGEDDDEEQQQ